MNEHYTRGARQQWREAGTCSTRRVWSKRSTIYQTTPSVIFSSPRKANNNGVQTFQDYYDSVMSEGRMDGFSPASHISWAPRARGHRRYVSQSERRHEATAGFRYTTSAWTPLLAWLQRAYRICNCTTITLSTCCKPIHHPPRQTILAWTNFLLCFRYTHRRSRRVGVSTTTFRCPELFTGIVDLLQLLTPVLIQASEWILIQHAWWLVHGII